MRQENEKLMNEYQKDRFLKPIIDNLKKEFMGSSDYHSGVNDGMYRLGKLLIDAVNEAALKQMMPVTQSNGYPVEALSKSDFLSIWKLAELEINNTDQNPIP